MTWRIRNGFTLIEIILYSGIFAIVSTLLITILVTITRIQGEQSASVEVSNQASFVLQYVQRMVADSSLVEVKTETGGQKTLVLYMRDHDVDPTEITLANGQIVVKKGASTEPLTTDKVAATSLNFVNNSNYPGHDVVSFDFALSFNTQNPQQEFSRTFRTAIARVNAATFDSSLVPGTTNTYDVGAGGTFWRSGNFGILGIGTDAPTPPTSNTVKMIVNGGLQFSTATARPICSSSIRGTFWVVEGGAGVKDSVAVCAKDAGEAYAWRVLY